jgi:hypothetical protein
VPCAHTWIHLKAVFLVVAKAALLTRHLAASSQDRRWLGLIAMGNSKSLSEFLWQNTVGVLTARDLGFLAAFVAVLFVVVCVALVVWDACTLDPYHRPRTKVREL